MYHAHVNITYLTDETTSRSSRTGRRAGPTTSSPCRTAPEGRRRTARRPPGQGVRGAPIGHRRPTNDAVWRDASLLDLQRGFRQRCRGPRRNVETPLTPLEFQRRSRALYPDRECVVDGGERLTYAKFFDRCDRWSAALQRLGVRKGDRVAYLSLNTASHLESFYAVPQIGACSSPSTSGSSRRDRLHRPALRGEGGLRPRRVPRHRRRDSRGVPRRRALRGAGGQQRGVARPRAAP